MKKKLWILAVTAICLSILASSTYAYFTDIGTARNVITSGGIDIKVVEQQLVEDILQPYPDQPIRVMPATTVSKIVSVRNMEQTAWIRANYTITVYDAEGKELSIPDGELAKVIVIEPNAVNWTLKDGWWYYNDPVQTEEMTEPLFAEVVFSGSNMDNQYQCCSVQIDVTAQGVQKANNGVSALEAAGWPVE